MDSINISENIVRLRRERKLTQEQLADFVGVTKASVSKWETGQSMPDILLLPRLAAYFDVTVDELIGYQPQLSKEQIMKLYQEFAAEFAREPFGKVMEKTRAFVKKYYSCYPFLFYICVLWLNHHMLAEGEEREKVLDSLGELCEHIKKNCGDRDICNDVIVLQAIAFLQRGRAQEVIDVLENFSKPYKPIQQSGAILTQAYLMRGDMEKAESFAQAGMYSDILSLVQMAGEYLAIHADHLSVCEETIFRIEKTAEVYDLVKLHPNSMAGFEYQASVCFGMHHEKQKTLEHLGKYVSCLSELFSADKIVLRGDEYFNRIEEWYEEVDSGGITPRDRNLVLKDSLQSFFHPAFAFLEGDPQYERLKSRAAALR